jgi:hypothetical protein
MLTLTLFGAVAAFAIYSGKDRIGEARYAVESEYRRDVSELESDFVSIPREIQSAGREIADAWHRASAAVQAEAKTLKAEVDAKMNSK